MSATELVTRVVAATREEAEKLRDKIDQLIHDAEERVHEVAHEIGEHLPGIKDAVDEGFDNAQSAADKAAEEAAAVAANVENRTSGVADHDVTSPGGVEGLSGPQEPVEVHGTVSTGAPDAEGSLSAQGEQV
jgi:ElaB/YqjD/DUF883 family membrane-anchored ribosome-binding protein